MPSTQKLSLDDAEATLVKLHPLLLLNYSQFVVIGSVPFLAMLAAPILIGYVNGFGAFVLALLGMLVGVAVTVALVRFGIPLVLPWLRAGIQFLLTQLRTPESRWIAGGVTTVFLLWFLDDKIGVLVLAAFLLLPFGQSSVVARLKRGLTLAAAILMWTGIAVTALGVMLYASDLNVHRSELIFLILGVAPPILLVWSSASRYLFISRISNQTRSLLQAHFRSVFSLEALRVFAGVPPVWNYLRSNKELTLVLFLLTSLFSGLAMAAAISLAMVGVRAIKTPGEALVIAFVILLVAFVVFAFLMQICDATARAKTRISANELIASDARKPVLFLRAFADDQVELPAASLGFLGTLLSLGRHRKTFDELLVEEGTLYGPVVALGNPKDKVPPYGVARGYFQNAEWKKAVSDLARDSALIVLCIDDTESVWWEVEHIFQNGYADKTLFVLPPKHRSVAQDKSLLPRLVQQLPSVPGATLRDLIEACSRSDTIAVSIDRVGTASIANSQTFSGFAYLALLRWFLRSRLEQTVPQTTFEAAPAFAGAGATLAPGVAGIAGAASYANAATATDPNIADPSPEQDAWAQPAWMKHLHQSGRGFGLLGALVVGLIEGLYYLSRHLLLKVRAASAASTQSAKPQPRAQGQQTYSASTAAASSSAARQSFEPNELLQKITDAVRNVPLPDWARQKPALAAGAALAALVFVGWVVSGISSTQTASTFTPPAYSPSSASYGSSPVPALPSANSTAASYPSSSDSSDAYRRLYEGGYVFDPNDLSPRNPGATSAGDRCMTAKLDASLSADDTREKRRLNNQVVKDCTQAIRLDPTAEAYAARGQAYKDLGRRSEAKADFRKALALDPLVPGIASDLDDLEDQQPQRKKRRNKHR